MTPEDVIRHFGGTQMKAAEALNLYQSSVSEWVQNGRVPWLRQLHIEKVTGGALKAEPEPGVDAA